ncbi:MAG: RluA family pseudouridine synthase [Planctomycetota bacterium]
MAGSTRRPTRRARRGDDFDVRVLDGRRETLSYRVADGEEGLRLDQFLAKRLSWRSRSSVCKLLEAGRVELSGRVEFTGRVGEPVTEPRASRRVAVGEIVTVQVDRPVRDEALVPRGGQADSLPRLYEDEVLIALDKPPNLPVHPAGRLIHHTVITALHREYRNFDDPTLDVVPKLCHRLDLETSGVLLVAKQDSALAFVQAQFMQRKVGKEYLVLVHGVVGGAAQGPDKHLPRPATFSRLTGDEGLIDLPLGPALDVRLAPRHGVRHDAVGRPARTRWHVVRRYREATLCRIELLTGRHHQIRAHFAALGHPVVGDKLYGHDLALFDRHGRGSLSDSDHLALQIPRQALHSHSLSFVHPTRGQMRIESPWPADLAAYCATLAT